MRETEQGARRASHLFALLAFLAWLLYEFAILVIPNYARPVATAGEFPSARLEINGVQADAVFCAPSDKANFLISHTCHATGAVFKKRNQR